jgi:hypothetical protein
MIVCFLQRDGQRDRSEKVGVVRFSWRVAMKSAARRRRATAGGEPKAATAARLSGLHETSQRKRRVIVIFLT